MNRCLLKPFLSNSQSTGPGWDSAASLAGGGPSVRVSFEPPNQSIHTFSGTVVDGRLKRV